ncbi:alpha-amylase [Fundicoccus culcitae]|uniref:Alpha-amylase n=1 Tax=Fundicoccus culcitae TaxID=2969821 RepID=A0ABY5P3G8_9LACT|nr:alpha-amylase [Fundicoccus culcitae]UUX33050.1 alpha-amylase [Fundicoccus culcitae]
MANSVIMQYFEWYLPDDGKHWQRLRDDAPHLAEIGITAVWMPPAFKATSSSDVGYGVYDIFDLGEFDQHGTVRTKYGTKDEYLEAINSLKEHGIKPFADVVLNHKANGDKLERFKVLKMDPNNRQVPISEPYEIEGWTNFTFPGRQGKYNDFNWHWYHFSGIDYDAKNNETGVYMILGENKGWADNDTVDSENGNFDYLMFSDIDFDHPEVRQNVRDWAKWFLETTGVEGFRLDAIKHIDADFMREFIRLVNEHMGEGFYVFGEYWNADYESKSAYLDSIDYQFDIVDVGLHMNFHTASKMGKDYDMQNIFDGSLMQEKPMSAVTFVDNHDTQRGQSLESVVEDWFKPLAYGMILLRQSGLPTVFYGDYYGVEQEDVGQASFQTVIDQLLFLRQNYAYGEEQLYFDHPHTVGFTRLGTEENPNTVAVVIANSDEGWKDMYVGQVHAGKIYVDYLNNREDKVEINADGVGHFHVNGGSIAAYVDEATLG